MNGMILIIAWGAQLAHVRGIIKGSYADESEFPFAISIQKMWEVHCGGILISASHTVTACHCLGVFVDYSFKKHDISDIQLIGGSSWSVVTPSNFDSVQLRTPKWLRVHPECSNAVYSWLNDYGIVKVSMDFLLSYKLSPVNIQEFNPLEMETYLLSDLSIENICVTIGWGAQEIKFVQFYSNSSKILKKVRVRLYPWKACGHALCHSPLPICDKNWWSQGKVCALNIGEGEPCTKDDGGALICSGRIFAMSTMGPSCGEYPMKPRLYLRLDRAYDFLVREMSGALKPDCSLTLFGLAGFALALRSASF